MQFDKNNRPLLDAAPPGEWGKSTDRQLHNCPKQVIMDEPDYLYQYSMMSLKGAGKQ
jgi:hypothetical protein